MSRQLHVPPPPTSRPAPAFERRSPRSGRRPGTRRSRRGGCLVPTLAVVILVLGLLAILLCIVATGASALSLPGQNGRINLLLLGIDRRDENGWIYRTDTIVVLTLDPEEKTVGMLSIPRDLQLPIPTHGKDRINTANVFGYLEDYPGGGPALLKATIETNFGIPIDRYVMIDFQAFIQIVDALGGIDVDVPETLHDTKYPDPRPGDPYAYKTVHFEPGLQHMDGQRALEYARSRMSTSDFDRARRQQTILLAIADKALQPGSIPRLPALAAIVADAAQTDVNRREMLSLAFLAAQVDPSNLEQVVIEPPMVYGYRRADGAAVQLPNWDLIQPAIDEMFGPAWSR